MLERGWSKTHGFFIVMGGFHLFEHHPIKTSNNDKFKLHGDDIPLCPLAARNFYVDDTHQSDIDFTSFTVPTKEEIEDKGKGDWLAKSVVLLQTSWFVMQCIARGIEHLPVTHLEIVTLAYAAVNFVIYIFWWNKPLSINRPVRVFRKPGLGAESEPRLGVCESTWEEIGNDFKAIRSYIASGVGPGREDRELTFWDNSDNNEVIISDAIVVGVGVCFGAIHCISWGFSFPTHTELLMWRVSNITITAVPIYITLGILLAKYWCSEHMGIAFISILPAVLLYILARAVTLVLAFTSLRDLPPGAYETVHWTTFIPHV